MPRSAIPGDDHDWEIRPSFSTMTTTTKIISWNDRQLIETRNDGDSGFSSTVYTPYSTSDTPNHQSFQALSTLSSVPAEADYQPSWYSRPTPAWTPNTLHTGSHLTQAYTGPNLPQAQGQYNQFYGVSVGDPVSIGYGPFVPQNSSMIASSQQPTQGLFQPQYPYAPSSQHDHGQLAYDHYQFQPYDHVQFQPHSQGQFQSYIQGQPSQNDPCQSAVVAPRSSALRENYYDSVEDFDPEPRWTGRQEESEMNDEVGSETGSARDADAGVESKGGTAESGPGTRAEIGMAPTKQTAASTDTWEYRAIPKLFCDFEPGSSPQGWNDARVRAIWNEETSDARSSDRGITGRSGRRTVTARSPDMRSAA